MDSLRIPTESSELVHDCENCEGLCCISLKLEKNKFPILSQDKEIGVPCQNLELTNAQNLFKCRIHNELDKNWKVCAGYSCFGAGQEVTRFFRQLGFSFSNEINTENNKFLYAIRKKNIETAFTLFSTIFNILNSINEKHGEFFYLIAKESIEIEVEEFSLLLEGFDKPISRKERDQWFTKLLNQIANNLAAFNIDILKLVIR